MASREWEIAVGQRWRCPDGDTLEIGMPDIFGSSDGWWVRHGDGRTELIDDKPLIAKLRRCALVSTVSADAWQHRRGLTFFD